MILTCVTTLLLNISDLPYNNQDFKAIARTQVVCKDQYKGCLKQFQKRERGIYRALCGEKQEFDKKDLDKAELDVILEEIKNRPLETQKRMLKKLGDKNEY